MNDSGQDWEQFMQDIGYDKQPDGSWKHCHDGDTVDAEQARLERSEFMTLKLALIRDEVIKRSI